MKTRWIFPAAAVAVLAILAIRFVRVTSAPQSLTMDDDVQVRAAHAALEGKPMPPLSLSGWVNGKVTAADMKGKVVLIDFYATWCGPCRAAIPHNNELLKEYGPKGLVLLGVCTDRNGQDQMDQLVKSDGIEYPTARDPELISAALWHVAYYPTYAIIDKNGIVRVIGLRPDRIEQMVRKLLAEKA